ncbi:hypothetical protein PENTCL1PPCAC_318 [Pristionchus entomophagus]|uniref:Smr domain-containing protein n=1 Tax=Pristionchus entomophagus TaxID=358040 RepID=A0AAV5S8F5_9BILA|nr:hypothetical protein PENTCL1PPCAC_318 [Pristionchus entomophagus]
MYNQWGTGKLYISQCISVLQINTAKKKSKRRTICVRWKNEFLNRDIIDLHGFRWTEDATNLVKTRIDEIRLKPSMLPHGSLRPFTLTCVSGAGNNSKKKDDPKLLKAVRDFLGVNYK